MLFTNRNKLLKSYFILQQDFGFVVALSGLIKYDPFYFFLYLILGFPLYFLLYNLELSKLSSELKVYYPEIYHQFGFHNPFTNQIRVMLPTILFKKDLAVNNEKIIGRIKIAKLSLIFTIVSFVLFPILGIVSSL